MEKQVVLVLFILLIADMVDRLQFGFAYCFEKIEQSVITVIGIESCMGLLLRYIHWF
nr:MAG TPA: hypothetical protein [Caudoviricetes sp.]